MRVIRYLLEKEFKQIFRNKAMIPIIFVMPVVQLLVLSFAVDYEIKNLRLFVVDQDKSVISRQLIDKYLAGGYFQLAGYHTSQEEAFTSLEKRESDLSITIPPNFEIDLLSDGKAQLQIFLDAIDGTKAGLASNYSLSIINDFNKQIIQDYALPYSRPISQSIKTPDLNVRFYYNPHMDYKSYMIPGILVILITMIGAFLSSMNIVREKELGTIEQLNVTPIKKYQFIIGKTIPFWILGLFELSIGLLAAKIVFDIPIVGDLSVLYSFAAIYLFLVLGFGLLISTLTDTQQQAMFISWFFLVIFILMGGLFTPIENMPMWAQKLTLGNPVSYLVEVARAVLLKGSGFMDLLNHFIIITCIAIALNILAILRYRKTV